MNSAIQLVPSVAVQPELKVTRPFHAWLHYHVLSHLDLGRDLSSIHDPTTPERPWARPLLHALGDRHARLTAQFLPLRTDDYPTLSDALERGLLAERLRVAWAAEHGRVAARWQGDHTYARRLDRFWSVVAEPFEACRAALEDPLPMQVLDVPALGGHGRMSVVDGRRVVALSLAEAPEVVLCQLVFAEAHALVEAELLDIEGRDTRPDAPGWALQRALDDATLDRCRALLAAVHPRALPALGRWRHRAATPGLGCLGMAWS